MVMYRVVPEWGLYNEPPITEHDEDEVTPSTIYYTVDGKRKRELRRSSTSCWFADKELAKQWLDAYWSKKWADANRQMVEADVRMEEIKKL